MALITELKREVLDAAIPVSTLLRKALIVAKELGDEENERWISAELKGYAQDEDIPDYRELTGRPVVRDHYTGWQYVYTQNLTPEMAHQISSFNFRSSMAELEANASQDFVGITYHPEMERRLIQALGGQPCVPAIHFSGIQFRRIVDMVRDRLTEWITNIPDPPDAAGLPRGDMVVEVVQEANQPRYAPASLRGFLGKNKDWVFQGIGTEILKWVGRLLVLLLVFAVGYFWSKKEPSSPRTPTTPSPTATPIPSVTSTPTPPTSKS
jgi:hypothetical protein